MAPLGCDENKENVPVPEHVNSNIRYLLNIWNVYQTLLICTNKEMFYAAVGAERWRAFGLQPIESVGTDEYAEFRDRNMHAFRNDLIALGVIH